MCLSSNVPIVPDRELRYCWIEYVPLINLSLHFHTKLSICNVQNISRCLFKIVMVILGWKSGIISMESKTEELYSTVIMKLSEIIPDFHPKITITILKRHLEMFWTLQMLNLVWKCKDKFISGTYSIQQYLNSLSGTIGTLEDRHTLV